ncbi:MAG TPA: SRPBCC domain-containing protein [Bacteroidia bacterium]|jgi:hypothetical protein
MKRAQFSVKINAPKEKVWSVLWNDSSYRTWTSVFTEGSYAVSDWNEGDKILFLAPDGRGMFSKIAKKKSPELMAFKHLGIIKDGKEQPEDEETKRWTGAMETYILRGTDGHTELLVELDTTDDHMNYLKGFFPKALEKVKELAEGQ